MPNLWKNGNLVETVDMYNVYKKCPKCGKFDAKMWSENRKVKENIDWTKPIEEHSVTYMMITNYSCKSYNHRWRT